MDCFQGLSVCQSLGSSYGDETNRNIHSKNTFLYFNFQKIELSRSTNICALSCVPCMRMIASLISSSVAGTETTPR